MLLSYWLRSLRSQVLSASGRRKRRKPRRSERSRRAISLPAAAECLEDRTLLSGTELVQIVPNNADRLDDGDVLHEAPSELLFQFSPGDAIDPSSLDGIQVVRSGLDNTFGDGNEVAITPGWIGLGDTPNEVILRFAETLPDDLYQITIFGSGGPKFNIAGQGYTGVVPPDTVGDVGIDYFIQAVNSGAGSQFTIYNKSDGSIAALSDGTLAQSIAFDSLDPGATSLSDPIVLYDQLANRWLLGDIADATTLNVFISQTDNVTDNLWYHYTVTAPDLPDYPKFAVWQDAYFVTTNEFDSSSGAPTPAVYALDRSAMLAGLPAVTPQRFTAPGLAGFTFQALTPADLDGQAPPAGAPGYFMRHVDDEAHTPASADPTQDFLEVWQLDVDFATPANSSFTKIADIGISEFDSDLNGLTAFSAFPQPGTSVQLDPLREIIMNRLQYRNFGGYETLVGNFVTDVDGTDHGGIRWFELRKTGVASWTLFQEGDIAPDATNRWTGAIAMDGAGNIAIGYNVTSTTVSPGLRYTGRLATDPLGTMHDDEERVLVSGTGFSNSNRWGDYSAMSIDPVDDATFWFTGEYANGTGNWATRIGAFTIDAISGQTPLLNDAGEPFNDGVDETITFELDLGAQVVAVNPQPVQRDVNGNLTQNLNQIVVYFNQDELLGGITGAENPAFYQLINTQETLDHTDDAITLPDSVAYDKDANTATLTFNSGPFAAGIPSGTYRLRIGISDKPITTTLNLGESSVVGVPFEEHASIVTAGNNVLDDVDDGTVVVPIGFNFDFFGSTYTDLYVSSNGLITFGSPNSDFSNDDLTSSPSEAAIAPLWDDWRTDTSATDAVYAAVIADPANPGFSQLVVRWETVPHFVSSPSTVIFEAVLSEFDGSIQFNYVDLDTGDADSEGASATVGIKNAGFQGPERLLVSFNDAANPLVGTGQSIRIFPSAIGGDDNSSFATATDVGTLAGNQLVINSQIERQGIPLPPLPGGTDEPGHREIPVEAHLNSTGTDPVLPDAIGTIFYNFQDVYGVDPQGNPLFNAINEDQKQRAREIFEIYSHYLGLEAVETESQGITVVTGDLRAVDPTVPTGPGGVAGISGGPIVVMDAAESWTNEYAGSWFRVALHEIGHSLGLGHSYDQISIQGAGLGPDEPVFTGDVDFEHLMRLWRPDATDIDLYRFDLGETGELKAEVFAERLDTPSLLNSAITLFDADGNVLARNDDYYSNDSFIDMTLQAGTYYIGVTSTGNLNYNPVVSDTGSGGTTDGAYQLRLNFLRKPRANKFLVDATGTAFDGDADGRPGGAYDFWFQSTAGDNTIFVDKANAASPTQDGSLADPFGNIADALVAANARNQTDDTDPTNDGRDVKIVRIVGNGGTDGDLSTPDDAQAYVIGLDSAFNALEDGGTFVVPKGVTVMLDQGALLKLQNAVIDVGSSSVLVDRSNASLQVLGTPENHVVMTSNLNDDIGGVTDGSTTNLGASPGDWGGLVYRGDSDREESGVFLNYVNHADITFGGGKVFVDSVLATYDAIHLVDARPEISFNTITHSADAAISADPNSFDDQIRNGFVLELPGDGSTIADGDTITITDSARVTRTFEFDEAGSPGVAVGNVAITYNAGESRDEVIARMITTVNGLLGFTAIMKQRPTTGRVDVLSILALTVNSNGINVLDKYNRDATLTRIGPDIHGNTLLESSVNGVFVRIETKFGKPIDTVDVSARFDDTDVVYFISENLEIVGNAGGPEILGGVLVARESGRLQIDGGVVVKVGGSRIEAQLGRSNLIAEGSDAHRVIMTSIFDDRFGSGGTFDTTSDVNATSQNPGDWGGIILNAGSHGSIDHAFIGSAGGVVPIEGDFDNFDTVEVHQADFRLTNSRLDTNAAAGSRTNRNGRGTNDNSVVFVRGAQPVIAGNLFIDNEGAVASFDANAMTSEIVRDLGRSTGDVGLVVDANGGQFVNNAGPLVRMNVVDNNALNGMIVRPEMLTTESIWDDADIVHVLQGEITVPNFHTLGGLRLQSSIDSSLVVKLEGPNAGFTAAGNGLDIDDRIGGTLQVLGQPLHPVVMTSLTDDTVGAGFRFDGQPQNDTNNDGAGGGGGPTLPTGPEMNNGTLIDNDVPTNTVGHFEANPQGGGEIGFAVGGTSGVTAQGLTQLFTNLDFIFAFLNYVDVGSDGGAINLGSSTITQAPTLVSDDLVVSRGNFTGQNGTIDWRAETRFDDGVPTLFNTITFSSAQPLGNLQFINYLDEDVLGVSDDILQLQGTPGQPDFRAFTLDQAEQIGFSQGGIYQAGPGLVNATFDGFAADRFPQLDGAITGSGTTYSITGNIDLVDLPQIGSNTYGPNDVTSAFAWTVDPNSNTATVTTFLDLIAEPANPSAAGDWRSVRLEEFSNDRNVAVANETEGAQVGRVGVQDKSRNDIAPNAQFLGELANLEKSGDENRRDGFEVHGFIAPDSPGDVDVYSFDADVGTEVWFDIDRTDPALNTVVELVDPLGNVLAQSINNDALSGLAYPLVKDVLQGGDFYTSNPNDAGMRVVLPVLPNESSTYFVRVRSFSNDLNDVHGGLTSGHYQLQIRLRQPDEHPGSTITGADIRYATNGIEVLGVPSHSPIVGDTTEVEAAGGPSNDAPNVAQNVGNLLVSERAAIAIAGVLNTSTDLDFYQFQVQYNDIQRIAGFSSDVLHAATIFDIDYADGLARANTVLSIFDANGRLVFSATDSNVGEDQPAPLEGADSDDLSRGSVGALDPYIGAIELPEGTYFAAVSSNAEAPVALDQFFTENTANALTRLEPINSLVRIAEDHIGGDSYSTAEPPVVPELINTVNPFADEGSSIVPFNLGDMVLFVSSDPAGNNNVRISAVDPFTGQQETTVGTVTAVGPVHDIILRGLQLMGLTLNPENTAPSDGNTGHLIAIDTGTGAGADQGDDGIDTYIVDPANPPNPIRANANGPNGPGVGINFEAITNNNVTGVSPGPVGGGYFAVGDRGDAPFANGIARQTNILYQLDSNGLALSALSTDRTGNAVVNGAGTQIVERGQLNTFSGTTITFDEATIVDPNGFIDPLNFPLPDPNVTFFNVLDGLTFLLVDQTGTIRRTYEINTGVDVRLLQDPFGTPTPTVIGDGAFFLLNNDVTATLPTDIYQFDTGFVFEVGDGELIRDGDTITITDNTGLTISFEFDDLAGATPGVTPGNVRVPYNSATDDSNAVIASLMGTVNALPGFNTILAQLPGTNRVTAKLSNQVTETSADGMIVLGTVGSGAGATMGDPILQVPVGGSLGLGGDGSTFQLSTRADGANPVTFEIDFTPPGTQSFNTGNIPVFVVAGQNDVATAQAIANAINSIDSIGIQAVDGLMLIDGETFSIVTSNGEEFFELDSDGASSLVAPNHVISFTGGDTPVQVAQSIAAAINAGGIGAVATVVGDRVVLGGPNVRFRTEAIQAVGEAALLDGTTFQLTTTFGTDTYELDMAGDGVLGGNFAVTMINTGDTAAQVAQRIAAAVNLNAANGATAVAVGDRVALGGPNVSFTDVDTGLAPATTALAQRDRFGARATATGDRVVVSGADIVFGNVNTTLFDLTVPFNPGGGVINPVHLIRINEADTADVVGQAIKTVVEPLNAGQILVGTDGARVNFVRDFTDPQNLGAGVFDSDFSGVFDAFNVLSGASAMDHVDDVSGNLSAEGTVTPGFGVVQVDVLAEDTGVDIANLVEDLMTGPPPLIFPGQTLPASVASTVNHPFNSNQLSVVATVTGSAPFQFSTGAGTGGTITGLAVVGAGTAGDPRILYAVDDAGGLYRVINPTSSGNARAQFIANVGGLGIDFQGLAEAPRSVENGLFAGLLIGIDRGGRLWAFDTSGDLQPIFVDAQTSVATGVPNANGLSFSNLERNLWSTSGARGLDPGHGINPTVDLSRVVRNPNGTWENGGTSLRFGGYEFAGGAHGSVESNVFSLEGYSAADQPVMYFNYFLETEDVDYNPIPLVTMKDSLRVFVSGDDGVWHLLATNDLFRSNAFLDEFDDPDADGTPGGADGIDVDVQPLFDATGQWRQARINLAPFAGQKNLKLRFDFSTAGSMNTGDPRTTGDELRALPGWELRDGQTFIIDGNVFEFDQGITIVTPEGASLADGQTLTIDGTVFEFDTGNGVTGGHIPVLFDASMTADEVAQRVADRIFFNLFAVDPIKPDQFNFPGRADMPETINRINLVGALNVSTTTPIGAAPIDIEGAVGAAGIPVVIDAGMTQIEVRDVIRQALADTFGLGLNTGAVGEAEPNDSLVTAQDLDDPNLWSLASNGLIGDINNLDTSTIYPHVSISGTGDGTFDYYSFTVSGINPFDPTTFKQGIFDIDFGINGADPFDPSSIDTELFLFGPSGALIDSNDNAFIGDAGSSSDLDAFLQHTFTRNGTYIIGVGRFDSVGAAGGITGDTPDPGQTYTLQVSVEDHANNFTPLPPGATGDVDVIKVYKEVVRIIGHSVDDPGPLGLTNQMQGDQFGSFNSNTRARNNGFEGAYIDDIIIGFAERGEMVTEAPTNNAAFSANPVVPETDVLVGEYQLEVRRTNEYGVSVNSDDPFVPKLDLLTSMDTNDRLAAQVSFVAPAGVDIHDGQTFRLSNTYHDSTNDPVVTFEFVDLDIRPEAAPNHVAIPFRVTDSATTIAERIRDAINSTPVHEILNARAALSDGAQAGEFSTSHMVSVYGNPAGDVNGSLDFGDIGTKVYAFDELFGFTLFGDKNLERRVEQGVIDISGNQISNVAEYGIMVDAGQRDASSSFSHPGGVRNTFTLDTQRLTPGAVLQNNVISGFGQGGILFSGDANAGAVPPAAVPFGKIVNNTIFGDSSPTGIGVRVENNASPTLLNNIIANTVTSISIDGTSTSTVVGTTIFKGNTNDPTTGTNAISLSASDPLFVDPLSGNFYLKEGSRAIDSSLNRLADRPAIVGVKTPLGIAPSDIFAPDYDVFGQLRVDDPEQSPPPGLGFQIFKDRGAIERSDFVGPIGKLIVPEDGGPRDSDPLPNSVLVGTTVPEFVLQLTDVGIGVDDSTVLPNLFELRQNGTLLTQGLDYLFSYNANTNSITFRSTIGAFALDVYTITIKNGITDRAGNPLQPNQTDGSILFTIALGPALSVGDVTVTEGDSGTTAADFVVTLLGIVENDITVDLSTADGTATVANDDYQPLDTSVTFTPGGPTSMTVTVLVNGDTIGENDENFFLNLIDAPGVRVLKGQGTATIVNDDGPSFSVDDVTVIEPDVGQPAFAVFTVSVAPSANVDFHVDYATADGIATAGSDYVAQSGTLDFAAGGPLTQEVKVEIIGDVDPEGDEDFFLNLSNPVNANLGRTPGKGLIVDDKPIVSVNNVTVMEGDVGESNFAVFTVNLSQAINREVRVGYITSDGTATAGSDYTAVNGTLVFSVDGATTQQILVPIIGDSVAEGDETFFLNLSTVNASLVNPVAQATITDEMFDSLHSAGPGGPGNVPLLQESQLAAVVNQAISLWNEVLNDSTVQDTLNGVTFRVADLADTVLGAHSTTDVLIDADAAGYGWFVDGTPDANEEFSFDQASGEFLAQPTGAAYGGMDLLTAVLHELGHMAGFEHVDAAAYPHDLMAPTLDVSVRRLPEQSHVTQQGGGAFDPITIGDLEQTGSWVDSDEFTAGSATATYVLGQSDTSDVRPWIGFSGFSTHQRLQFDNLAVGTEVTVEVHASFISSTAAFNASIVGGSGHVVQGSTYSASSPGYGPHPVWTIKVVADGPSFTLDLGNNQNSGYHYLYFDAIHAEAAVPQPSTAMSFVIGDLEQSGSWVDSDEFASNAPTALYTAGQSDLNDVRPWIGFSGTSTKQQLQFDNLQAGMEVTLQVHTSFISSTAAYTASIAGGSGSITQGASYHTSAPGYGPHPVWTIKAVANGPSLTLELGNNQTSGYHYLYFDAIDVDVKDPAAGGTSVLIGDLEQAGSSVDSDEFGSNAPTAVYTVGQSDLSDVRPWIGFSGSSTQQRLQIDNLAAGTEVTVEVHASFISSTAAFTASIAGGSGSITQGASYAASTPGYGPHAVWTIKVLADGPSLTLELGNNQTSGYHYLYFDAIQLTTTPPNPLQAAGPGGNVQTASLQDSQLVASVDEAVAQWDAVITDPAARTALHDATVEVADLSGNLLGATSASGATVLIDTDAAGYGWFVDATPGANEEFTFNATTGQFEAAQGPAAGAMDLLTVLLHELGHVAGFEDLDATAAANGVMTETLDVGIRRLPGAPAAADSADETDPVWVFPTTQETDEGDTAFDVDTYAALAGAAADSTSSGGQDSIAAEGDSSTTDDGWLADGDDAAAFDSGDVDPQLDELWSDPVAVDELMAVL